MNELIKLINQGRLILKYTKHSRYPLVFIDGQLICETELRQFGFTGIADFEKWHQSIKK